LMYLVGLFILSAYAALDYDDLCGTWISNPAACKPGQQCAGDTTTYVTTDAVQFYDNRTFVRTFRVATGSCPFADSSGTVILAININGEYTLHGDSDVDPYTKIEYDILNFDTYLLKNNKQLYYTTTNPGPCLYPEPLLNNLTEGCPCGGTWTAGTASFNVATGRFQGGRRIIPSQCPVGSCPSTFFFNDATTYGNLDITEPNNVRTMKITTWNADSNVGYSSSTVLYTFTADPTRPCSGSSLVASIGLFFLVSLLKIVVY